MSGPPSHARKKTQLAIASIAACSASFIAAPQHYVWDARAQLASSALSKAAANTYFQWLATQGIATPGVSDPVLTNTPTAPVNTPTNTPTAPVNTPTAPPDDF